MPPASYTTSTTARSRNASSSNSGSSATTTTSAGAATTANTSTRVCSVAVSPWASITQQTPAEAAESAQRTSTVSSEYRLRTECCKVWTQRLRDAQREAWRKIIAVGDNKGEDNDEDGSVLSVLWRHVAVAAAEAATATETTGREKGPPQQPTSTSHNDSDDTTNNPFRDFCVAVPLDDDNQGHSTPNVPSPRSSAAFPVAEVLPLINVSSPLAAASRIDRSMLAHAICEAMSSRSSASCYIHLPRLLSTLQDTLQLVWMDILRQHCSHDVRLQNYWECRTKKRKRTTQSIGDLIVEYWYSSSIFHEDGLGVGSATPTTSLVLLLEQTPHLDESKVWNQWVSTLQTWRSDRGIPVTLVVMEGSNSDGGNNIPARMDRSGRFGIRSMHVAVPAAGGNAMSHSDAAGLWLRHFLQALHNLPLPPMIHFGYNNSHGGGHTLSVLLRDHLKQRTSCSTLVEAMQTEIADFYARCKGSFVWDALGAAGHSVAIQPSFCAWFCTYEKAQQLLSSGEVIDASSKAEGLIRCRRIQVGPLRFWWNLAYALMPLQVLVESNDQLNLSTPSLWWKILAQAYQQTRLSSPGKGNSCSDNDDVEKILRHYLQRTLESCTEREVKDDDDDDDKDSLKQKIATMVREWIVLLPKVHQESTANETPSSRSIIIQGMRQMVDEMNDLILDRIQHWSEEWMLSNPLMISHRNQHREDASTGRVSSENHALNLRRQVLSGLTPTAQLLYGIMDNCLSISAKDWYRTFAAVYMDEDEEVMNDSSNSKGGCSTVMHEFMTGIHMLQECGLIQGKEQLKRNPGGTSRREVVYEKVAVVWC